MTAEGTIAMAASILPVDGENPSPDIVARAVELLRAGEIVVAPTETRYGLLTRGDQQAPLTKLFEIKHRPASMPSAVFLPSIYMIPRYAEFPEPARLLAEQFLPGPLTLILKPLAGLAWPVANGGTLGVRVSSLPLIARIVEQVDFPVTATSANLSGGGDLNTVSEIAGQLGDGVALYLDGGILNSPVSTVVDCIKGEIQIIRTGGIPEIVIRETVRRVK